VAPALVLRSSAGEELFRRDVEHLRAPDLTRLLSELGFRPANATAEQQSGQPVGGTLQAATLGLARRRRHGAAGNAAAAQLPPPAPATTAAAGAAVAALGQNQEALTALLEPMKLVQHASPPPSPVQPAVATSLAGAAQSSTPLLSGRPRRASLPPGSQGVSKAVEKLRDGVYIPTLFSQTGAVDRAGNAASQTAG